MKLYKIPTETILKYMDKINSNKTHINNNNQQTLIRELINKYLPTLYTSKINKRYAVDKRTLNRCLVSFIYRVIHVSGLLVIYKFEILNVNKRAFSSFRFNQKSTLFILNKTLWRNSSLYKSAVRLCTFVMQICY